VTAMPIPACQRKRRKEPRFADPKKPKSLLNEIAANKRAKAKAPVNFYSSFAFKYCPQHGKELAGNNLYCSQCRRAYVDMRSFACPPEAWAVTVDSRLSRRCWSRKIWGRVSPPFHANVQWLAEPPIAYQIFSQVFSKDFNSNSYYTSQVETSIKILQTTWAVESFCQFEQHDKELSDRSCKVTPKAGEVIMVVPPVEIGHTCSEKVGPRIYIRFGWIQLTKAGTINIAEGAPEPAEGWQHVKARIRDQAVKMYQRGLGVHKDLIKESEAILKAEYPDIEPFIKAREKRDSVRSHFIIRGVGRCNQSMQTERVEETYNPSPIGCRGEHAVIIIHSAILSHLKCMFEHCLMACLSSLNMRHAKREGFFYECTEQALTWTF
jgi:hypothetical protein